MTPDFNLHNDNHQPPSTQPASGASNTVQRDRFELLSAYLDGEVTAGERKQVEEWLATDPIAQRLHGRLLKLRQGFQSLPVPVASEQSIQETVDRVFAQVERRPKLSLVWGGAGAAIAALFIGALAIVLPTAQSPTPQFAVAPKPQSPAPQQSVDADPLLVALDKPLVDIPQESATPKNSSRSTNRVR